MTMRDHLDTVYAGTRHADRVDEIADDLRAMLDDRGADGRPTDGPSRTSPWSQDDVWVISYPDQFRSQDRSPLATLPVALDALAPEANGVHVLPCYPWSSDDGYAVIDPLSIEPDYGDWDDVRHLARGRRVMLDAVVNHVSSESPWFQAFLAGEPEFVDGFVTADADQDLSAVVRPRSLPLLTPFETSRGRQWVWTTFSADQVDVDVSDPAMLLRLLDVLVTYAEAGAAAIRLDAIGFLWKEPGTSCIHLPQTHAVVKLMRAALDRHHPDVVLITETNVPHDENVAYLGDGDREAQAVYQFTLPPLVLHTFHEGDATALSDWAQGLSDWTGADTTFLNFLASHDGIGLRPAEGLLADDQVTRMAERVAMAGGVVNARSTPRGDRPYELCTTWFDAMALGDEARGLAHHVASHMIMLLLPGLAGVYVHSLLGTANDHEAYRRTGMGRSLNRRRFASLDSVLPLSTDTRAGRVNGAIREAMALRRSNPAFHPDAPFEVQPGPSGLFRFTRGADADQVLVEVNVTMTVVDGIEPGRCRITPATDRGRA